ERRAVLRLLPDRLVVEDDAGDIVPHRLGGAEQHLAIVAAVGFVVLDSDRVETLLNRAGAFVGGQNTLAGGDHGLGDIFQSFSHESGLLGDNLTINNSRRPTVRYERERPSAETKRSIPQTLEKQVEPEGAGCG